MEQEPPARTQHNISNVEVEDVDNDEREMALVRCNLTLFETRASDAAQAGLAVPQVLPARCEYLLERRVQWSIMQKKVLLLTRDLPLPNLSFIV